MKRVVSRTAFWILLFVLFGSAGESAAQTPSLGVGYQAVHVPDNWINTGLNLDISAPLRDQLDIVGEFGFSHQGSSGSDPVTSTAFHVAAGPRWSWLGNRAVPFVQILAGVWISSADIPQAGGGTFEDSDVAFMLQPGAGVYVPVGARWGVVGQADFRPVFISGNTDNQFRIVLGARFAFR
jgi:hypothetical protein